MKHDEHMVSDFGFYIVVAILLTCIAVVAAAIARYW